MNQSITSTDIRAVVSRINAPPAVLPKFSPNDPRLANNAKQRSVIASIAATLNDHSSRQPLIGIIGDAVSQVMDEVSSHDFASAVVKRAQTEFLASDDFRVRVQSIVRECLDKDPEDCPKNNDLNVSVLSVPCTE